MSEVFAYIGGISAALFWGTQQVVAKRGFEYGGTPLHVAVTVVTTGFVLLWLAVVLVNWPGSVLPDLTPIGYGIFLMGGLVGTALGRIANYSGVQRVGAGINSAVIATNPVFATVLAFLFLGELVSAQQLVGIAVVLCGLVVLTFSKGGDLTGWEIKDLRYPLAAALAYGVGSVIRRYGLLTTEAIPLEATALNETAAFVGLVGFMFGYSPKSVAHIQPRGYVYFVGAGVLSALGLLMFFTGLQNGPVAIVATLVGTSTLFATVLTYVFSGDLERITRGIVTGAVLVVGGIALITL